MNSSTGAVTMIVNHKKIRKKYKKLSRVTKLLQMIPKGIFYKFTKKTML